MAPEPSILQSTKKMAGIGPDQTAFDLDMIVCINSAFTRLKQLGVTPLTGVPIEDEGPEWVSLGLDADGLAMVKLYVYLKARITFDPPGTSFLVEAIEKQIREHEWLLQVFHDSTSAEVFVAQTESEVTDD